jgi:outer membrane biosynthesis protein TonB
MRSGVVISVLSHVVLVAVVLLGTPKLFDSVPVQTVEVDLVPTQDAPPDPVTDKPPEKTDEKPAPFNPLPESQPLSQPPEASATKPQPEQPKTAQSKPEQPQAAPVQSPGPQPQTPPQQTTQQPSIFDPANIPALLDLPNAPQFGFDAESTTKANLTGEEKGALKAHLRKCWKLPDGISPAQSTRVVMRIYLKRDGGLAADPTLIEASASRDGPVIMKTAIRTLKDCQPYAFLPAAKYKEWKVLDLSFSPRDMAGD